MSDKKISPSKTRKATANSKREAANAAQVAKRNLEPATSEHSVLRRDSKGKTYEVTVTRRVRASKQLRKADRAHARWVAAGARAAAALAEDEAIAAELAESVR